MQPTCTPECHMSTSGPDPTPQRNRFCLWQHGDMAQFLSQHANKVSFSTTWAPAHLCVLSVCHVTSHNRVESQYLQARSFILLHCIKFPAFHRITKAGRDLQDQLVQPPAQHHLNHPKPDPQEPHPDHFQKQWLHQGSRHLPWLGEALSTINHFSLSVLLW